MTKINLLPWREERRQELKRQFFMILAGMVLVGVHWLMAALALRFGWFGTLVRGAALLRGGGLRPRSRRSRADPTPPDCQPPARRS